MNKKNANQIPMYLPFLPSLPLVSVLVANFNYGKYIGEAIESVEKQDYRNYELIICDDGSTDDSLHIIQEYVNLNPKIRLIQKENGGHASALNRAFQQSRGEIICILDADDFYHQKKVSKIVKSFQDNSQSGIVIHNLQVIDGNGGKKNVLKFKNEGYLGPEIPTLRKDLLYPQASGLSFRREVLKDILPIPEDIFQNAADWGIAYVASYLTHTALVPETLASYRIHQENISGTTSTAKELNEKGIEKILGGMDRVLGFLNRFMIENYGFHVPIYQTRNVIEHRLLLGFLRMDHRLISAAIRDLKHAYRLARRDYPLARYLFWLSQFAIPLPLARISLSLAFKLFKFQRRLINGVIPQQT